MLHYSVDNELMSDLYRDYRQMKGAEYAQLHELGEHYLSLIEGYDLEESTIKTLQGLVQFETEEELESVENGIVHGYLTAKAALRKEQAEYKEFVRMFDGEEQQALNGLSEYVVGQKKIPYKIKNRILHVDVLSTPAMSLELDFADVLIEDGRHPREILITHLSGECFERTETVKGENGAEEKVSVPYYRLSFVNGLSEGPYQAKESSFVFRSLKGSLHLYNYDSAMEPLDVDADKLPWRILMHPLKAMLEKAQILGVESLDKDELRALPLLCVFYELIQFYLAPTTEAGIGKSLIRFDEDAAENFAFSQNDLEAACEYLTPYGLEKLTGWLHKAIDERAAFCRYWIQFASMKKAETLYGVLTDILDTCSQYYEKRVLPLSCRKHHGAVRRALNEYFCRHKWRGEYPYYRRVEPSSFLEVSNVYKRMYTYINEKQKAFYVDFIEGVTENSYSITAVAGYVLLKDGENARDYRALNGYFLDGGRRNSHIVGQITINDMMNADQVIELLNTMMQDIMREFAQKRQ